MCARREINVDIDIGFQYNILTPRTPLFRVQAAAALQYFCPQLKHLVRMSFLTSILSFSFSLSSYFYISLFLSWHSFLLSCKPFFTRTLLSPSTFKISNIYDRVLSIHCFRQRHLASLLPSPSLNSFGTLGFLPFNKKDKAFSLFIYFFFLVCTGTSPYSNTCKLKSLNLSIV